LLVLATNPFALIFILPALHAWLWLPNLRNRAPAARAAVFLVGFIGPVALALELARRYGLGFDAPWYVLQLAASGVVAFPLVAAALATGACGAQLAVASAGRYAPYPKHDERPVRGPIREAVRRVVLMSRTRRHRVDAPRRRYGG
jgi:hypothetical protein